MKGPTFAAYRLWHEGALALAEIQRNGIKIDEDRLNAAIADSAALIKELKADLRASAIFTAWRRKFGEKALLTSRPQLAAIFFGELGYPVLQRTGKKGLPKADEDAFIGIRWKDKSHKRFIRKYFKLAKIIKLKSTYFEGLKKETYAGFVHPVYNLHTVTSFRSSSSSPNSQNFIKDERLRRCFIPRSPGNHFVETDFGAHEWKIGACRWNDPKMIEYASDPTKDVHRDRAAELFLCEPGQVSKEMRFEVKSGFVFAKLYGNYWKKMAKYLWDKMATEKLALKDGTPVRKHLAANGIKTLGDGQASSGTYEALVKKIEDDFDATFIEFGRGKDEQWERYKDEIGFRLLTGFWIGGVCSRNFFLNVGVQGPGFHCLLWSIIRIRKLLKKKGMKALLIGTIHDSILADVPSDEIQRYLRIVKRVMTVDIRKAWDWIVVPLLCEHSVAPLGESWYAKTVWEENAQGIWGPLKK